MFIYYIVNKNFDRIIFKFIGKNVQKMSPGSEEKARVVRLEVSSQGPLKRGRENLTDKQVRQTSILNSYIPQTAASAICTKCTIVFQ